MGLATALRAKAPAMAENAPTVRARDDALSVRRVIVAGEFRAQQGCYEMRVVSGTM